MSISQLYRLGERLAEAVKLAVLLGDVVDDAQCCQGLARRFAGRDAGLVREFRKDMNRHIQKARGIANAMKSMIGANQ